MVFDSYLFMIFFPVVLCVYHILPMRVLRFWLLVASYYFYSKRSITGRMFDL